MNQLITLVIYDISSDDLRFNVAKFLKSKGLRRIQKSAFAGPLTSSERCNVEAGLRRFAKVEPVNIQVYPLTEASFNQRVIIGVELDYEEDGDIIL
ncbi:CRISPR-associated endonuclease Cas2 [Candidatus Bathyarchaeota archaeon]|nr:CRISPR-associated endonuclease Cas2 [Candidatus Bathyarchaeota archaeon]